MIDAVCEWLPASAADNDQVRAKIGETIDAWSSRWFSKGRVSLSSLTVVRGKGGAPNDGGWRRPGALVAVTQSRSMAARLQERTLDIRFEGLIVSAVDRAVLSTLTQRLIDDLVASLEALLNVDGAAIQRPVTIAEPYGPMGGVELDLTDAQGSVLKVAIPTQATVALCKEQIVRRDPAPFDDRANLVAALGPSNVTLEAMLGRARLSVAELRGLGAGDVVVLDMSVDEGCELGLLNSDQTLGRAKLSMLEGRFALTLTASAS